MYVRQSNLSLYNLKLFDTIRCSLMCDNSIQFDSTQSYLVQIKAIDKTPKLFNTA